jgi:hypothetical protein
MSTLIEDFIEERCRSFEALREEDHEKALNTELRENALAEETNDA